MALALSIVAYENLIHASQFSQTTLFGGRKLHYEVRESEAVICNMPCKVMKGIPLSKILISYLML